MSEPIRDFVPGPVHVLEETLRTMTAPVVGHRSAEFKPVYQNIARALPGVFRTSRDAYLATSSATFLMEAGLVSLTRESVLATTCGAFSERFRDVARSLGRAVDELAVPWGEGIDPDLLRAALRRKRYEAVTLVHNETSTGVMNPLPELARVVREESDALLLVDTVSSLASAPVETEAWDLDFVFAGSQKGLAAPPGLAVFAFSDRAERRAETIPHRGYYGDLLRYRDKHREGGPITTVAVSIAYALDRQLARIAEEGLEERWRRHATLARATWEWAEEHACALPVGLPRRSPTVSCIRPPTGVAAPSLVTAMKQRGFTLGGGYAAWKASTFRIGHMGEVREVDLRALFAALAEELDACRAS